MATEFDEKRVNCVRTQTASAARLSVSGAARLALSLGYVWCLSDPVSGLGDEQPADGGRPIRS